MRDRKKKKNQNGGKRKWRIPFWSLKYFTYFFLYFLTSPQKETFSFLFFCCQNKKKERKGAEKKKMWGRPFFLVLFFFFGLHFSFSFCQNRHRVGWTAPFSPQKKNKRE